MVAYWSRPIVKALVGSVNPIESADMNVQCATPAYYQYDSSHAGVFEARGEGSHIMGCCEQAAWAAFQMTRISLVNDPFSMSALAVMRSLTPGARWKRRFPFLSLRMFPPVTNAIFFAIVLWRELSCFDPFISLLMKGQNPFLCLIRSPMDQLLDPRCHRFLRLAHRRIRHVLPRFPRLQSLCIRGAGPGQNRSA